MRRRRAAGLAAIAICAALSGAALSGAALSGAAWAQQAGAAPEALSGRWDGEYVCNQGLTGLSLSIAAAEAEIRAVFVFYEAAANPGVPDGCFEMTGRYDPATRRLDFIAGRWIHRPDGYFTVDLAGVVDAGNTAYSGDVLGFNCGGFAVVRTEAPEPRDHACYDAAPVAGGPSHSVAAASSRR